MRGWKTRASTSSDQASVSDDDGRRRAGPAAGRRAARRRAARSCTSRGDVRVGDEDDGDADAEPAGHAEQHAPQARHEQPARGARRPPARGRGWAAWCRAGIVSATSMASMSAPVGRGGRAPRPRSRRLGSLIGRPPAAAARGSARPPRRACAGRAPARGRGRPSRGGARATAAAARRARRPPAAAESPSTTMPVSPSITASGAPPERPAITGRPVSAASAKTMPKPSTSKPPQRVRHGEAKRSAARSQSVTAASTSAPVRCTRSPTPRRWARS